MTDIQSHISHSAHSLERLSVLGNPHLVTLEQEITALSDGTFVAYATIPWLVRLRCFTTPLHASSLLRRCRLQLHYDRDPFPIPTNGCPSGSIAFILICSFSPFCVWYLTWSCRYYTLWHAMVTVRFPFSVKSGGDRFGINTRSTLPTVFSLQISKITTAGFISARPYGRTCRACW